MSGRLPQFFVLGAMKCGTTTLRHLLRQHPDVFMPGREIFLFALDDLEQHPGALSDEDGHWRVHDVDRELPAYLEWYGAFFAEAGPAQILGEGSTSYLPSRKAPGRIAALVPHARLVVMLRDPVERAYSHYWHVVRSGAVDEPFETLLRRSPATVLQRSCYKAQIDRYLEHFPATQMKFVLFEQFVADPARTAADVAAFVGATSPFPALPEEPPRNAARMPRSVRLQLARNRWLGPRGARDRFASLGTPIGASREARPPWHGAAEWVLARLNPMRPGRPPEMRHETRRFLNALLARENRGLADLTGLEIDRYWFKDRPRRG